MCRCSTQPRAQCTCPDAQHNNEARETHSAHVQMLDATTRLQRRKEKKGGAFCTQLLPTATRGTEERRAAADGDGLLLEEGQTKKRAGRAHDYYSKQGNYKDKSYIGTFV